MDGQNKMLRAVVDNASEAQFRLVGPRFMRHET